MSSQENIKKLVQEFGYSRSFLSAKFNVDQTTISRWINGDTRPRSSTSNKIKKFLEKEEFQNNNQDSSLNNNFFRECFDSALNQLRESFHRRGKLSSRNEILEQLGIILFCQIIALKNNEKCFLNLLDEEFKDEYSMMFIKRSNYLIDKYLPSSLSQDILIKDFYLKIKSNEKLLIKDILLSLALIPWQKFDHSSSIDLFNELFGKFLSDSFVQEKQLGQYLTPTEMIRAMVEMTISKLPKKDYELLIDPENCRDFGYILDPSCGVGSFLTEVVRYLYPRVRKTYGKKASQKWLSIFIDEVLIGIDKSERMIKLAVANLTLSGGFNVNLHCINSLSRKDNQNILKEKLEGKVAIILTNPPFGAEFLEKDIHEYKIWNLWSKTKPKKINSEVLYIERYIDWLKESGFCISVVPENILTNRSIYKDLRDEIFERIFILAIISFPRVAFAVTGTTAKTSIFFFQKGNAYSKKATFFSNCKHLGFKVVTRDTQKVRIPIKENDLPEILKSFISEKQCSKFNWINISKTSHRWDATYHASLSPNIINRINYRKQNDLMLIEVAQIINDKLSPKKNTGKFKYIEIGDIDIRYSTINSKILSCASAPSRARKKVKTGDVIVSTVRPEQKKIGLVSSNDNEAICSTGFVVIRPIKIDSLLLVELLKSDFVLKQLLRNNIGIAYPTVDESCFHSLLLPIDRRSIFQFNKISSEIIDLDDQLDFKRNEMKRRVHEKITQWETEIIQ